MKQDKATPRAALVTDSVIATLDDLQRRRRTVTDAIITLAAFYGLSADPWLEETLGQMAAAPIGTVSKPTPATTLTKPKRTKKKTRAPRPTLALRDYEEKVLAALQSADEPKVSPKAIRDVTGLSAYQVQRALKALQFHKKVSVTGQTTERRVALTA